MGKPAPLTHTEERPETQDHELVSEQEGYFRSHASVQFVASCIQTTRKHGPAWLTPTMLRERYSTKTRLEWLKSRPDTRQGLVTKITSFGKKSSRIMGVEHQVMLIDLTVDSGDATISDYEQSFHPRDLACYGDAADYYVFTVAQIPWKSDAHADREIVGELIKEFLEPRGDKPAILTHLQVRRAIPEKSWQTHIPDDIRGQIARNRLDREAEDPTKPYTAKDEFDCATPQILAKYLPLEDLKPIFQLAMEVMDFAPQSATKTDEPTPAATDSSTDEPKGTPTMLAPATEQEHAHSKPTALLPASNEGDATAGEAKADDTASNSDVSVEEVDASELAEIMPKSDLPPAPSKDETEQKASETDKVVEEAVGDLVAMGSSDSTSKSDPPSSNHKPDGTNPRRDRFRSGDKPKPAVTPPPFPPAKR